jgi:hypothetical protein
MSLFLSSGYFAAKFRRHSLPKMMNAFGGRRIFLPVSEDVIINGLLLWSSWKKKQHNSPSVTVIPKLFHSEALFS